MKNLSTFRCNISRPHKSVIRIRTENGIGDWREIGRHIRNLDIIYSDRDESVSNVQLCFYDRKRIQPVKYELTAMSDLRLTSSASSVRKSLELDDLDMACGLGNGAKYLYRSNAVPAQITTEKPTK